MPAQIDLLLVPAGLLLGLLYLGLDRKIIARMQSRIGPPVWQPFCDIIKLFSKEDVDPEGASSLFTLFPPLALATAATTLLILPFGPIHFGGDVLLLIYLLATITVFQALAGFSSNSYFGWLGGWRLMLQLVGYELPFVVVLATLVFATNSASLVGMSASPLFYPFAFIAFLLCAQAKLLRGPFHIPDAETEIVAGAETEYSASKLGMLHLTHALETFILVSLAVTLFFGYTSPIPFLYQSFLILFILIALRAVTARLRIDQSVRFLWFVVTPIAIIDLLKTFLLG